MHTQRTTRRRLAALVASALLGAAALAGCSSSSDAGGDPSPTAGGTPSGTVTLVTHGSWAVDEKAFKAWQQKTGITVKVVKPGDAGTLANQLVLTKDRPLGDVVYGIDNTFASRAVEAGVFAPYESPELAESVRDQALAGADGKPVLSPVDQGDVCLNVDDRWFDEKKIAKPVTFDDLLKPEYKDLTVVTNPATSSPGLAMLAATVAAKGEDGYLDWWKQLAANGVKVDDDWDSAYYTDFSGADGKGPRPIVLSYSTSPAYTVSKDGSSSWTSALLDTCFRQVEYAGVLTGAKNPTAAQAVVDYLLSADFGSTIPENMYMYPVNPDSTIPAAWKKFAPLSPKPWSVDATTLDQNREQWIKDWTAAVLG